MNRARPWISPFKNRAKFSIRKSFSINHLRARGPRKPLIVNSFGVLLSLTNVCVRRKEVNG